MSQQNQINSGARHLELVSNNPEPFWGLDQAARNKALQEYVEQLLRIPAPDDLYKVEAPKEAAMSDTPTQREVDFQIQAVEARIDSKLAGISSDIKIMSNTVVNLASEISESRKETRIENRNTRITMVVTAIAVVLGVWAAVSSVQSSLLTAFQTGLTALQTVSQPAAKKE
jgi:hypothetical protein